MKKGNLLIVDDEPALIRPLKMLLSEHADVIYTANDGLEALDSYAMNEIHCILCDINMPRMSGVDVIKNLREKNFNVPFIFYTGHGNRDLMLEAAKYGAMDFLNKPDLEGLEEVIIRGLKKGVNPQDEASAMDYMSEYQKLLNELEVES